MKLENVLWSTIAKRPLVLNSLYLTGESPNLSLYFVPKISSSK
jgi:hypothetical protein